MNSKGISEVVTVILIILLAVAAVIIIWQVIKPLIQRSSGQAQASCLTIDLSVTNVSQSISTVTVKRGAGSGDIKLLKIVTTDSSGSITDEKTTINELETKIYTLTNYAAGTWTLVEVYPVVESEGGTEITCPNAATRIP